MIIKVIKSNCNNGQFFEYIDSDTIKGYGNILSDKQLDILAKTGKTPLASAAWESLSHLRIRNEINRLIRERFKDKAFEIKLEDYLVQETGELAVNVVKIQRKSYKSRGEN